MAHSSPEPAARWFGEGLDGGGVSGAVDFGDFWGDEFFPAFVAFVEHAADVGGPELEDVAVGAAGDADDAFVFR